MTRFLLTSTSFFLSGVPVFMVGLLTIMAGIYYTKMPGKVPKFLKFSIVIVLSYLVFVTAFFVLAYLLTINKFTLGPYLVKTGRLSTIIKYGVLCSAETLLLIGGFGVGFWALQKKFKQFSPQDVLASILAFSIAGLGNLNIALGLVLNNYSYAIVLFTSMLATILLAFLAGAVMMLSRRRRGRLIIGPAMIYSAFLIYLFGFNYINTHLGQLPSLR